MFKLMLAVAVAACASLAPVADAAPTNAKKALFITIVCPSGTYEAVVNGNGAFTAAHAVDSNTVLIPIAFGEFRGTFTDPDGIVSTVTDPPLAKGNAVPANGRVELCNYSVEQFFDGASFVGGGSVTGFIPGR